MSLFLSGLGLELRKITLSKSLCIEVSFHLSYFFVFLYIFLYFFVYLRAGIFGGFFFFFYFFSQIIYIFWRNMFFSFSL